MLSKQEYVRLSLAVIADSAVGLILEQRAFELTRCPDCGTPEFTHEAGCKLAEQIEEVAAKVDPKNLMPELGPLISISGSY